MACFGVYVSVSSNHPISNHATTLCETARAPLWGFEGFGEDAFSPLAGAMAMRVVVRLRPSKDSLCECDPHVGTHIKTPMKPEGYEFPAVLGVDSTQRCVVALGVR